MQSACSENKRETQDDGSLPVYLVSRRPYVEYKKAINIRKIAGPSFVHSRLFAQCTLLFQCKIVLGALQFS